MPDVPVAPIVGTVLNAKADGQEALALVGFVGRGEGTDVRLYPDVDFGRWMDIPAADVVTSTPLTTFNPGRLQRTVVWVDARSMLAPIFNPGAPNFAGTFAGSEISTWQLIPATRLVAAEMLDLLPHLAYDPRTT
jgi:hypothetical protein